MPNPKGKRLHHIAPIVDANLGALTHAVGTADGTVADVGGAFNQATLNDNFKELSSRTNAILLALRSMNLIT